jgi:hypothetical protein
VQCRFDIRATDPEEKLAMLGLRTDVMTMNLIVSKYRLWHHRHPGAELNAFFADFIDKRYGSSIGCTRVDRFQASTARRALAAYGPRLNHDGDPSLLALLGALAEAEGFGVRPAVVVKRVYSRNQDIPSYILGGFGIDNLGQAFAAARDAFGAEVSAGRSIEQMVADRV